MCMAAAIVYGLQRWEAGTSELRAKLAAARTSVNPGI
jgi:hypothetical protein